MSSIRRPGSSACRGDFGMSGALWIARLFHIAMIACLVLLSLSFGLGVLSWAGIGAIVLLLLYEHRLVQGRLICRAWTPPSSP